MKCKNIIPVLLIALVASSCSKKNLNLPEASVMPINPEASVERPKTVVGSDCKIEFEKNMSLVEIASLGNEMRTVCKLTQEEVLNLAKKIFD